LHLNRSAAQDGSPRAAQLNAKSFAVKSYTLHFVRLTRWSPRRRSDRPSHSRGKGRRAARWRPGWWTLSGWTAPDVFRELRWPGARGSGM